MTRRRRCGVCDGLFSPDPRVGQRQRTCSQPSCQVERHRRACQAWRDRERPAVEEDRLRRRLGSAVDEVHLDVARDEIGWKVTVVVEECLRLVSTASRDEFQTKHVDQRRDLRRVVRRPPRDETALSGPAP